MEKNFYLRMYSDKLPGSAKAEPLWEIGIRDSKGGSIIMRFKPFLVPPTDHYDDRAWLWDLDTVRVVSSHTPDEMITSANLMKRVAKMGGLGLWHMLPHELIRKGYKPNADRFPAKYAPAS